MTCIVAVTNGEKVTIGGDSAGVSGWDLTVRADAKVWAAKGWVFGFTSSFRMGQLLRWSFTPPPITEGPLERYMATEFVNAVRTCLRDGGYSKIENSQESGGEFLVGHAGRIFRVASDFQVGEPTEPFDAVGCGDGYALGALHALDRKALPATRARRALAIAESCSAGVRGPFHVAAA